MKLNKRQLQAYCCVLESVIEREVTEPLENYFELQKYIRKIKDQIIDLGLDLPLYEDWMLETFPQKGD